MKRHGRRDIEEIGLSFLDVICCGFGAIILLLMITKTVEPQVLEMSAVKLDGLIAERERELFEIRGQIEMITRMLDADKLTLDDTELDIAAVQEELTRILGKFSTTILEKEYNEKATEELAAAKQDLTDEMERLLAQGLTTNNETIGGITADSEYIIFVIDTSGSMQNYSWGHVLRKVNETLNIYPRVKGIQVMSDMGDFMFPEYAGQWMPDSVNRRRLIIDRLRSWAPYSNSSPVEGIVRAINLYYAPDKRVSVYVFGDDYTGGSIEDVVEAVDRANLADETGRRRVRIHAIGFPYALQQPPARTYRFAALMRELAARNEGAFVGLLEFQ